MRLIPVNIEKLGFGTQWKDIHIDTYEGYLPNMSDYHMHDYYEISLILSGDVKVILPKTVQHGTQSRLVLTPPMTSHLMVCQPHLLYKRVNLLFSADYLTDYVPEWKQLLHVFGKHGRVLPLTEEDADLFLKTIHDIQYEENAFRKRLLLLMHLSKIADQTENINQPDEELPTYISNALSYLQEHYAEKIVASDLAWKLGIGRTTLMMGFKRYTGTTLTDYLTRYRLKQAILHLREKKTQQHTAELCGFGDACNLIRSFRHYFGMTPKQYLKQLTHHEVDTIPLEWE